MFCTIQWARDDIAAAIEDACDPSYDVELDRHGPQGEQVEALIDQVIGEIGSDLQDRSIAMGWDVIANFLPDEVIRRAAALGAPEEERSFPAEPVPVYVRDWYVHTYPDDDLGQRINPDMTFDAAMQAVSLGGGFYDALGVDDSIVRERVFRQLDVRTGIPYDTIYEAWLDAKPVPGWHPVQPPELAPHVPEEALHKPFPPRLADEAASSRTASDMLAGSSGRQPFPAAGEMTMIRQWKETCGGKEGCDMKKTVWKRIRSAAAMAVLAAVTLTACNSPEAAIRDDLTNQLETIKQGDDSFVSGIEENAGEDFASLGIDTDEFATAYLDGFDYTVEDVSIKDGIATAKATITCKSLDGIMTDFQNDYYSRLDSLDITELSDQDALKQLAGETMMDVVETAETAETDCEFTYTRTPKGTWKCDNGDEALAQAMN